MTVQLIAWTHFEAPAGVDWATDADGGQALAEFAGRACYESWDKPNPATATNAGYLAHILRVGHLSVVEHATATMYITGVSRSLTHELIRHRHFSYSQLSQRYVNATPGAVMEPAIIADDPELHILFTDAVRGADEAYAALVAGLDKRLAGRPGSRKAVRQAARAVLPNATETRIVVTGNFRAWRHFIAVRAAAAADVEIREIAVDILTVLQRHAPNVFGDFTIVGLDDGSRTAHSGYPHG